MIRFINAESLDKEAADCSELRLKYTGRFVPAPNGCDPEKLKAKITASQVLGLFPRANGKSGEYCGYGFYTYTR